MKVSPPEVTLDVGGSQQLKWTVEPSNATNKKLIFKSSDDSVATVSNTGYITAVKNGNAVITVTSDDNNTIYDFCKVKARLPCRHGRESRKAESAGGCRSSGKAALKF